MEILRLSKPERSLHGDVVLGGSKSLSNRVLVALALAGADPAMWLTNLSESQDTATLMHLLQNPSHTYHAGDAGTAFRFLTAYLALQPGDQVLTGSARMQERPIGPLVEALRQLGCDIAYLGKPGFPPIRIPQLRGISRQGRSDAAVFSEKKGEETGMALRVDASVSSQFMSALLLIGPYLPGGLTLVPEGTIVSRPYVDMTINVIRHFGCEAEWRPDGSIRVLPGEYQPKELEIESDWSSGSYWYAMIAFSEKVELMLHGFWQDSWQGDSIVAQEILHFKTDNPAPFRFNFRDCPDLAQTFAVICAGLGVPGEFSGLETLAIKETDRCAALTAELAKVGVHFGPDAEKPGVFRLSGKAAWQTPPRFATHGDHRMAMALAALAMLGPIEIENPGVVAKSYPEFWEHLHAVGFVVEKITEP